MTNPDTRDLARELGHFVQPYFQIHINRQFKEYGTGLETIPELLDGMNRAGVLATFIHEVVHYFQFIATTDGISLMENLCSLYEVFFMIQELASKSKVTPAGFCPPLAEWLRAARFTDESNARRRKYTEDLLDYCLERLQRKRGALIQQLNHELPNQMQERVYPVSHHPLVKATWSEYYACEWSIAKNSTCIFNAGSDSVREGMARAIEIYFECGFDSNLARQRLIQRSLSASQTNDFDSLKHFINYYWLFHAFTDLVVKSRDLKHYSVETFIAICELALCSGAGNSSTARLAVSFIHCLVEHGSEIPILKLADQLPFFNAICKARKLDAELYHNGLADWLRSVGSRGEMKGQRLAPLIFQWQISYQKLSELRRTSRTQPFLFLSLLSEDSLYAFLGKHLDRILLTFNDCSFPLFRDRDELGSYLSLVTIQDFFLRSLFEEERYTCVLFRERERQICGYLREGNECDSTWPKERCDYDHPCANMQSLGQWWKKTFT